MIPDFSAYQKMDSDEQLRLVHEISSMTPFRFSFFLPENKYSLPVFTHNNIGIDFVLLFKDTFLMGFSKEEEEIAKKQFPHFPISMQEMRPVKEVGINAFLVSRSPILWSHLAEIRKKSVKNFEKFKPVFVKYHLALSVANTLGCTLPTEEQWEYFCRAKTKTLFCFGDQIPNDDALEKWLTWDLESEEDVESNNFGIVGLFFGEWCSNFYKLNYEPEGKIFEGEKVIRGGGAYFWPWQDDEWVWCLSANRFSSSELPKKEATFRLVFNI